MTKSDLQERIEELEGLLRNRASALAVGVTTKHGIICVSGQCNRGSACRVRCQDAVGVNHRHYPYDIPMAEANMLIDYLNRREQDITDLRAQLANAVGHASLSEVLFQDANAEAADKAMTIAELVAERDVLLDVRVSDVAEFNAMKAEHKEMRELLVQWLAGWNGAPGYPVICTAELLERTK